MTSPGILIVDDDKPTLHLVSTFLHALGLTAIGVESGEEAITTLAEKRDEIGLVLMDLAMPQMSGVEVCRQIRSELGMSDLPIVALTARIDLETEDQALAAGFNRIVHKPFSLSDLQKVLTQFALLG
ncbi:MAG: hypothetical protein Kow00124_28710 [Anaerolineae bacterium]